MQLNLMPFERKMELAILPCVSFLFFLIILIVQVPLRDLPQMLVLASVLFFVVGTLTLLTHRSSGK